MTGRHARQVCLSTPQNRAILGFRSSRCMNSENAKSLLIGWLADFHLHPQAIPHEFEKLDYITAQQGLLRTAILAVAHRLPSSRLRLRSFLSMANVGEGARSAKGVSTASRRQRSSARLRNQRQTITRGVEVRLNVL